VKQITYTVTNTKTNEVKEFKSIKKSVAYIEKWCEDNKQHTGEIDICKNTLLWNVGTFSNPILQFEKHTKGY
jgi:hypothetical protein